MPPDTLVSAAAVDVAVDPGTAFRIFTEDIPAWWRRGTVYWNDAGRGIRLQFEPGPRGRLVEVYTDATGSGFQIGRVRAWTPGSHLAFSWREAGWAPGMSTLVDVRFDPIGGGTRLSLRHTGWETLGDVTAERADDYGFGWQQLLGFFRDHAEAPARPRPHPTAATD